MRITGGAARSIQLKTLDLPQLRPATDQIRQAIFNSIGEYVVNARFLDLFAGSGAYGLEAFSRGASGGIFVEKDPKLKKIIEANLAAVAKSAQRHPNDCKIRSTDALKFSISKDIENIKNNENIEDSEKFDIVFCDPPYALIQENFLTLSQIAFTALKKQGLWLMEHPAGLNLPLPQGFQLLKTLGGKGFHTPNIAIYQKIDQKI